MLRHDRIRDTLANILEEVCTDVQTEPHLIPIEADFDVKKTTAIKGDKARLDVSCVGLWSPLERTFMDVRIVHPCSPSYKNVPVETLLRNNERAKKRSYNMRVIQVEKSTFTPMVLQQQEPWEKSAKLSSNVLLAGLLRNARNPTQTSWDI